MATQVRQGGAIKTPRSPLGSAGAFDRAAVWSTFLIASILGLALAVRPDSAERILGRDGVEGSLVETATALVLTPAIVYGAIAAMRRSPLRAARVWLALWVLAAVYFAGEEASWGQWIFGWDTPAPFEAVNRQHETNLHNINVWLNQKPQALAEIFVGLAGFLLPLWKLLRRAHRRARGWLDWVVAPPVLIPAALCHVLTKVCIWLPGPQRQTFGHPELQELAIAWFAAWYIVALARRLIGRPASDPQ